MPDERFRDRRDAGRRLAGRLHPYRTRDPLVLALPRGGVPVAYEVARELDAPLDVLVVRKLGVPWQPELGFGAVGAGGVRVLNDDLVRQLGLDDDTIDAVTRSETREVHRRLARYRGTEDEPDVAGRTVLLVDDGLATGSTALAAVRLLKKLGAGEIVLAVPVAPPDTLETLRAEVEDAVAISTPAFFQAVGAWYEDFTQTTDAEVEDLLGRAAAPGGVA